MEYFGAGSQIFVGAVLIVLPEATITKAGGVLLVADGLDKLQALIRGDKTEYEKWLDGLTLTEGQKSAAYCAKEIFIITIDVTAGFVKAPTEGNRFIYRILRADEDPTQGLIAKKPGRGMTVEGHVRTGSRNKGSQFISGTKDEALALERAAQDNCRVVKIDLSKVETQVIDISTPEEAAKYIKSPITQRYATSSAEVLIVDEVPAGAIKVIKE